MNEYNGYFRVVTTVDSYDVVEITDDLTGESLGYHYENETRTNSLYVLDGNLQVVGKIEGLAEDEQVYSARFMGDTGYFVTFKQIDLCFPWICPTPQSKDSGRAENHRLLRVPAFLR